LHSLAAAQDILTANDWKGAELGALARHLLLYIVEGPPRFRGGSISRLVCRSLRLIFNELATNAVKYGALSTPSGKIELGWHVENKINEGTMLRLTWRERGGPNIPSLDARGFGSALIERSLAGAKVERLFDAEGFITIELTSNFWPESGQAAGPKPQN
jgi:two-component system CheB/CheR fusion protein